MAMCLSTVFALRTPPLMNRRTAIEFSAGATNLAPALAATAAPPPMPAMVEIDPSKFRKIPGGGQGADLRIGTGSEIVEGSKVSLQWVLRRSNGYFVDASNTDGFSQNKNNFDESSNFVFTVGSGEALPGIDAGVRGMKQGGTRRLVLPIKAAYSLPIEKSGGPLPDGYGPRRQIERELQRQDPYNYFYFELEATRVR